MKTFKDKVAVVTGSSDGIGLSVAKLLANEGAKVVMTGRSETKLLEAKAFLKSDCVLTIKADISKLSEIDTMYKEVFETFGKIDIIIANAGIGMTANVEFVDEFFFDEIVNINYKGTYFTVQKAIPMLNKNASIVLISSVHTYMGISGRSVYASTKSAVTQLAKNFASDLIDRKIRVNSVSPGFTNTSMISMASPEFLNKIRNTIPMKRLAEPDEIAQVVLFLASDKSSYITGTDIIVDGGLSRLHEG